VEGLLIAKQITARHLSRDLNLRAGICILSIIFCIFITESASKQTTYAQLIPGMNDARGRLNKIKRNKGIKE